MRGSGPGRERMRWAVALLTLLIGNLARGLTVQGSLGASSDNVFRGISLSDEQPSLLGDLRISDVSWSGGLAVNAVRLAPRYSTAAQVIPYLAFQQPLDQSFSASLSVRHYDYLGDPDRNRYDYDEAAGSLSWKDLLTFQLIGSPDTYQAGGDRRYGRGAAFAAELTGREPLPYGFDAQWGVGYYDLQRQVGAGYAYWSAALSRQWGRWTLAVLYVGTDATARYLFGSTAGQRWVGSAVWSF